MMMMMMMITGSIFKSTFFLSRFAQLLFPKENRESHRYCQLKQQCDPEPSRTESLPRIDAEIGENSSQTGLIGSRGSSDDGHQGAKDLSRKKSEENVEASESLKEDHSET